jgi:hypothetical protein
MRKAGLVAVAAVIAAGAGYYGLIVVPTHRLREGLDAAIAQLPPGYTVKYGGARYSLLSHTAELTDLSVQHSGDTPITATIAKLSVKNPNLTLADDWNHAAGNPTALKPDQPLPVADRIAVRGVEVKAGPGTLSIADSAIDKPRIYPWALLHPGLPSLKTAPAIFAAMIAQSQAYQARLKEQQQNGEPPSMEALREEQKQRFEEVLPLLKLEAAGVAGTGFDGFDADKVALSATMPANAGTFAVSFRGIREGAYDRGLGGEASIDDLVENLGPAGKVIAKHASNSRIALRDTIMRVLNDEPLSMALLDGSSFGGMEMEGLSMTVPTSGTVEITGMSLGRLAFDHGFVQSASFSLTGLKQNVADLADERSRTVFRQLGLKQLTLSMGATFQWNAEKMTASLSDVGLKIDELGALRLTADLGNIGPAGDAGVQTTLISATLRYDDASAIDRFVGMGGKRTAQQTAEIRQQFAMGVARNLEGAGIDAGIKGSAKAISDFAAAPHSLTISLAPPMPVPIADIRTIATMGLRNTIGVLGLSIVANQ